MWRILIYAAPPAAAAPRLLCHVAAGQQDQQQLLNCKQLAPADALQQQLPEQLLQKLPEQRIWQAHCLATAVEALIAWKHVDLPFQKDPQKMVQPAAAASVHAADVAADWSLNGMSPSQKMN